MIWQFDTEFGATVIFGNAPDNTEVKKIRIFLLSDNQQMGSPADKIVRFMALFVLSSSHLWIGSILRVFGIIISCGNEAIIKSFEEGYIFFIACFYSSFFIACLDNEYMVEMVVQPFQSSTTMLIPCKNSFWNLSIS